MPAHVHQRLRARKVLGAPSVQLDEDNVLLLTPHMLALWLEWKNFEAGDRVS